MSSASNRSDDDGSRVMSGVLWLGLLLLFFGWCLRPIYGIDVFFHVAIGREVLTHGLPATDVFSAATPDAPWTPFQTGYAVTVAWLDRLGGLPLLRIVHAGATAAGLTLFVARARRATGSASAAAMLTTLLLVLFDPRIRVRPHVVNFVLEVAVLLPVASGAIDLRRRGWMLGLPLLAGLWGFFHSLGALWLVAVVGTRVVLGSSLEERWRATLIAGLCLVAIVALPGNALGMWYVIQTQPLLNEFVPEVWPSWTLGGLGHPLFGAVLVLAPWVACQSVLVAAFSRPERARWPVVLAAGGLAVGALGMGRLVYYSAFALVLVWPEVSKTWRWSPRAARWAAAISAVLLGLLVAHHVVPRLAAMGGDPWRTDLVPGVFPVDEVRELRDAGIGGDVYNETIWGGYLLYMLHPDVRVLTDGRITFEPEVVELLRYERSADPIHLAEIAWSRYGIDLLVWRRGRMKQSPGWERIVHGPVADVWSRAGPIADERRAALEASGTAPR